MDPNDMSGFKYLAYLPKTKRHREMKLLPLVGELQDFLLLADEVT
jgi:hypothetical protein